MSNIIIPVSNVNITAPANKISCTCPKRAQTPTLAHTSWNAQGLIYILNGKITSIKANTLYRTPVDAKPVGYVGPGNGPNWPNGIGVPSYTFTARIPNESWINTRICQTSRTQPQLPARCTNPHGIIGGTKETSGANYLNLTWDLSINPDSTFINTRFVTSNIYPQNQFKNNFIIVPQNTIINKENRFYNAWWNEETTITNTDLSSNPVVISPVRSVRNTNNFTAYKKVNEIINPKSSNFYRIPQWLPTTPLNIASGKTIKKTIMAWERAVYPVAGGNFRLYLYAIECTIRFDIILTTRLDNYTITNRNYCSCFPQDPFSPATFNDPDRARTSNPLIQFIASPNFDMNSAKNKTIVKSYVERLQAQSNNNAVNLFDSLFSY